MWASYPNARVPVDGSLVAGDVAGDRDQVLGHRDECSEVAGLGVPGRSGCSRARDERDESDPAEAIPATVPEANQLADTIDPDGTDEPAVLGELPDEGLG